MLLQSWIDNGSAGDINKEKFYPFVVIPAVARMPPGKILNLKILPTEKIRDLPGNRESVFWINLYEIPGVKKTTKMERANKMENALNTQLKIIYRPFKESMNINSIADAIKYASQSVTDNGHSLELDNPSPYYVTPVAIKVKSLSGEQFLTLGMTRMIAPFSHRRFNLAGAERNKNVTVEYTLVDEEGKYSSFIRILH